MAVRSSNVITLWLHKTDLRLSVLKCLSGSQHIVCAVIVVRTNLVSGRWDEMSLQNYAE